MEKLGEVGVERRGKNSGQQMGDWTFPLFEETAGFEFIPRGGWDRGGNIELHGKGSYSFSSLAFVPLPSKESKVKRV